MPRVRNDAGQKVVTVKITLKKRREIIDAIVDSVSIEDIKVLSYSSKEITASWKENVFHCIRDSIIAKEMTDDKKFPLDAYLLDYVKHSVCNLLIDDALKAYERNNQP